jgi:acyl-CoA synthetase (AMP-forming)/AMP-acid ligase II
MNIADILRDGAKHAGGDRAAIVDRDGQVSFRELDQLSARMAAVFADAGLRVGDRALVVHPISIRLYAVLIGLFRLGATALFLDPSAGRAYLDRCCRLAAPRAFIGVPKAHLLRLLSGGIRRIPIKVVVTRSTATATATAAAGAGADAGAHEPDNIEPCGDDMPALLTFTSGSTGEPKAVVRTHGFLLAQHRVLADTLKLRPGATDVTTLPVFALSNLAAGVTSVLPDADLRRPGAIDPVPVLRQIERYRPASLIASPAFLDRLISHASLPVSHTRAPASHASAPASHATAAVPDAALASFEHIFTGGAPVFPRLLKKVHAIAPQATVTAVYGSTEAEPIAHIDLDEIDAADFTKMQAGAGLLAGRPVDAIALRIMPDCWGTPLAATTPDSFEAEALPSGSIGEIVVTGPHVLRGYLDGIGDAETKVHVGDRVWHRTGDAGYLDDRGRLWLMGRCSARITDAHGTLYPFAVEAAAQAIDGIRRAALFAREGARLLAIELDPTAPSTTRDAARHALEWAKLQDIVVVKTIPVDRRHNAKVDYVALQKLLVPPHPYPSHRKRERAG